MTARGKDQRSISSFFERGGEVRCRRALEIAVVGGGERGAKRLQLGRKEGDEEGQRP